jgi:ABC-type bacteriocin/lantibiotic exporter with double-glycine peptidase domain
LGFRKPNKGLCLIDGKDIQDLSLMNLRSEVNVVL